MESLELALTITDALPVFREVRRVKSTLKLYCLSGQLTPLSIDDLEYAIATEYDATIDMVNIPFKSDLVRGLIRIWDPVGAEKLRAQIILAAELNEEAKRYVQAKELCHIILHSGDNCTKDPTLIIEHFVQWNMNFANGESETLDVKNENLADLAAIELLFPYDDRAHCKKKIAEGTETIFGAASWLGIPEHEVEFALSDRYMRFAATVWDQEKASAA